jgi:hypothetical protein
MSLSPRCGGAEEKPELRRSGDGAGLERRRSRSCDGAAMARGGSGGEARVAAKQRRWRGAEAEEKPELQRSSDGVRWVVSWRARRTPRAKETGATRRLGNDEQDEGGADGTYS